VPLARSCPACKTVFAGDACAKCTETTHAPPPKSPQPRLPGYEILETLGRGGMGVVYRARQIALDRVVALKTMVPESSRDPEFQGRFEREAKSMAALSHPNIVTVHDYGEREGFIWFAMELVEGTDLRRILTDKKRLPPGEAAGLVVQVCDALEYAHSKGVVHRDVKPENVLVDSRGRVRLTDFGLAKILGPDAGGLLTQSGAVLGTARYMAPEQMENPSSVDHRADVFSVGVVFYELLTGERPLGQFDPPSKKADLPAQWDAIVLRALAREPGRRFASIGELRAELARAGTGAPPPQVRRSKAWLAVVLIPVIGVSLYGTWRLTRRKSPPHVPAAKSEISIAQVEFQQREGPFGDIFTQAWDPLPENPFRASTPDRIEILVKFLRKYEVLKVPLEEIRSGYVALWSSAVLVALETAAADRLTSVEGNRWCHAAPPFFVTVVSGESSRAEYVDLVRRVQRKLRLPESEPDLPLGNLALSPKNLPRGWSVATDATPFSGLVPSGVEASIVTALTRGGTAEIGYVAIRSSHHQEAVFRASAEKLRARKFEIRTARNTATLLVLMSDDHGTFEKLAIDIRRRTGHPAKSFDTIVPSKVELPEGFEPEVDSSDPVVVLRETRIDGLAAKDIRHAYYARSARSGREELLLLELADADLTNPVWKSLASWGERWTERAWVCAVAAQSRERVQILQNRMREKFGLDPVR